MQYSLQDIDALLQLHHDEAYEGIVEVSPSRLARGQGTQKNYYILKIDLVGSTILLASKRKATYLKLAHTFLSTVDRITQDYGADSNQTEYAGDSIIAYFPDSSAAEDVLRAACIARTAVVRIGRLLGAVGELKPKCKVVLHYAPLIVAKIGPRANAFVTAIGHPIHRVAKIEKDISADVGRVTDEFFRAMLPANRQFFIKAYREESVLVTPSSTPQYATTLAHLLMDKHLQIPTPSAPQYQTINTPVGYDIKWPELTHALGLVQGLR